MVDRSDILRSRDIIRDHFDNVLRMMDDVEAGRSGHSVGTVDLTCNSLASALQAAICDADKVKLTYRQHMPRPLVYLPLAARLTPRPFGRRPSPDSALPVTVSPAGCA